MNTDQRRWLEALLERLRKFPPGRNYQLDPLERELILMEIDNLREQIPAPAPE